jgi:ArsR family transcriptional regulator
MSNKDTVEVEGLAAAFAALSNPRRLRMFIKLATSCCAPEDGGKVERARFCCAGELGEGLALAPSTVSHHLKELRQAGLVHVERHGRRIDCWVSAETLRFLASFFSRWQPRQRRTAAGPAAAVTALAGTR